MFLFILSLLFSQSADVPNADIKTAAEREMLRQARWEFNLYFTTIAASVLIGGFGGGLLLCGKTTEGTVTTAVGLSSGAYCMQLARESAEKLEKLTRQSQKQNGKGNDTNQ